MTVFTIGELELKSRTQTQEDWQPVERGVLQFRHTQPMSLLVEVLADRMADGILAKAMKRALSRMAESRGQESEGREITPGQLFTLWQKNFKVGGDTRLGARLIASLLQDNYVRYVDAEVGAQVKALSSQVPLVWQLTMTWDPAMNEARPMEWVFTFEARYPATLVRGGILLK